ncbi:MAG: TRAP transporter small permease subunit [Rubrivivax sp.]|nr:TRAP transporter small permease subunit [Rubrivivax sp.]
MRWAILACVALAAFSALSRKLFLYYSNAWSELQWVLLGAVFLFGAADVLRVDEHVRVDVLSQRWSARTRAWLDVIALAAVAVPISLLMTVLGAAHAWSAFVHGERSYMADGLIVWPARALVPIGFVLFALQCVAQIIRRAEWLRAQPRGGPGS